MWGCILYSELLSSSNSSVFASHASWSWTCNRIFSYTSPHVWEDLPCNLNWTHNIHSKTHLFHNFGPQCPVSFFRKGHYVQMVLARSIFVISEILWFFLLNYNFQNFLDVLSLDLPSILWPSIRAPKLKVLKTTPILF